MRKFYLILLTLGMLIWANNVFSYMINDNTLVSFDKNTWSDRIGDFTFEIYGINVSWTGTELIFDMFTNFNHDGDYETPWGSPHYHAYVADLFLDINKDSIFDFGVAMKNHADWVTPRTKPSDWNALTVGLYSVTDFYKPSDFWSPGFIYGQYYDKSNPKSSYTAIKSGTLKGNAGVTINDESSSGPYFRWQVTINRVDMTGYDGNGIDIFWGGANCANDAIYGRAQVPPPIPEPGTLLLLGSELMGLAGYVKLRFMRRKKSAA